MGPPYLKEIDHPSIIEFIDERFNGITALITEGALIYGGAINSILAGLSIEGDLDIAISETEFMALAQNITSSTMWVQTDGDHVPERDFNPHKRWHPGPMLKSKKYRSYKEETALPLNRIAQFETVNGATVQVVQAKARTGDLLEDALSIVRSVDLKCCGVAVDKFGRMFEAVEGGYDDCLNRILRINKYDPLRNAENTKARIHKYLNRGWQLGTSIDAIMENFRKAQQEHMRQQAARAAHYKRTLRQNRLPHGILVISGPWDQGCIKIYSHIINKAGLGRLDGIINELAMKQHSCALERYDQLADKKWFKWYPKKGLRLGMANMEKVAMRTVRILKEKHNIDLFEQPEKEKKKKIKKKDEGGYDVGLYKSFYGGGTATSTTMYTTTTGTVEVGPEITEDLTDEEG